MTLPTQLLLVIQASIILSVFAIGLRASSRDATLLLREPGLLARSLAAMYGVMPLCAAALALLFNLHPAVRIALVALALSPVPPLLPKKALRARGEAAYTISLLVGAALFAILFIPAAMGLLARALGRPLQMRAEAVAILVLTTVLAPLVVGIAVRSAAPRFSERAAVPIGLLAGGLLVIGLLPVLFTAWPGIVSLIGNGTLIAITAFTLVGLAAGHLLGGPDPERRSVLALCTASRHPGVAIVIAASNFPEQKLVAAAVLLYLIVSTIVSMPYLVWMRRAHPDVTGAVRPGRRASA